jgi:hypothetical protein
MPFGIWLARTNKMWATEILTLGNKIKQLFKVVGWVVAT